MKGQKYFFLKYIYLFIVPKRSKWLQDRRTDRQTDRDREREREREREKEREKDDGVGLLPLTLRWTDIRVSQELHRFTSYLLNPR